MCAKHLQLCPTLCDPIDYSLTYSSVHGILQTRTPEWVAMPSSRGSTQTRDRTCVSYVCCIGGQVLYNYRHPRSPALCLCCVCVVAQLYLTLCDPVNCSLPGSSLYGILLATILEWVAMSSSKGFFQFRDETTVSCFAVRFFTVWATREVNNMSNKFQIVISINQKKKKTFWIYIEFMW